MTFRKHSKIKAFLFLFPITTFAVLFVYYPFIKNIIYSFCRVNQNGVIKGFAYLDNYRYAFSRPDFLPALVHTLIIAAINVPVTLAVTVILALIAEKKRFLSPVYETLFTMPMGVSMSAACIIFKSMFSPGVGFINYFFGIKTGWFESADTALASCIILTVWMGIGFDFLLILSALRAVPKSIMETTMVDGIELSRRILKVQLPLISPTLFYVFCSNFILAMMTSAPMIIIMGVSSESAATTTLISMMYQSGFSGSDYSLSAVLCITAFTITFVFIILSFVFEKKGVFYR